MRTLLFFFCLFTSALYSQRTIADSLRNELSKKVKSDTIRAFQYNELAWYYLDIDIDSARYFAEKGLSLSKRIDFNNGIYDGMNVKGIILRLESKYDDAIALYDNLIKLRNKNQHPEGLTGTFNNLGSAYYDKGNYANALKYYKKSIENAEKFHQDDKVLQLYNNLGVAYKSVGLYDLAIETFNEGLIANKLIHDSLQQGLLYLNIATVYHSKNMHPESIKFSLLAKNTFEAIEAHSYLPDLYYNLILAYKNISKFDKAKQILNEFYLKAKYLDEAHVWSDYYDSKSTLLAESNDPVGAVQNADLALSYLDSNNDPLKYGTILIHKANALRTQKKNKEALETLKLSEKLILQTEDSSALQMCFNTFYDVYKALGDNTNALYYFEKASEIQENLDLQNINNQIATLNSLNDLEQKEQALALSNEKNKLFEVKNQKQSNLIFGLFVIGVLILLLLIIFYRSNLQRKKVNHQLVTLNQDITTQKEIIETKQEEIVASIEYARRIQNSLLAKEELIKKYFPASFVLFKPKDIVSGDFYWGTERGSKFFLAVCDSTGHGVPGAFMSALNSSYLNEAINKLGIEEPGEVFNHVRKRLVESIAHEGAKDGMDGTLLCFDKATGKVSYAAAFNPPIIVGPEEIIVGEVDRIPIGLSDSMENFRTFELNVRLGQAVYLSTDGYIDQFGGEKGKKLKQKGYIDLLNAIQTHTMEQQLLELDHFFENWRAANEQIDDVCVACIKF